MIISTLSTNSEKKNKIWEVRVSTSKNIGWIDMELPPTGPQTVALDFHVWPWILSSFVWELLDFDVLPWSIDFGVEEGHNLASEFLPEGLFEGLTLSLAYKVKLHHEGVQSELCLWRRTCLSYWKIFCNPCVQGPFVKFDWLVFKTCLVLINKAIKLKVINTVINFKWLVFSVKLQ